MQYLVSEKQLRLMVEAAGGSPDLIYSLKKMYSFLKHVFHDTYRVYKINIKFLLTWGSAIAGIVMPLDEWIRTRNFNISDSQINLILCGVAAMLYYDNKRIISQIKKKIDEEGLTEYFKESLNKAKDLRSAFEGFLKSIVPTLTQSTELLSYSFLIPIIGDLQKLGLEAENINEISKLIGERFLASGVVVISGLGLVKLIKDLLKRISK